MLGELKDIVIDLNIAFAFPRLAQRISLVSSKLGPPLMGDLL